MGDPDRAVEPRELCKAVSAGIHDCIDRLLIVPERKERLADEFDDLFPTVVPLYNEARREPERRLTRVRRDLLLSAERLAELCQRIFLGVPNPDDVSREADDLIEFFHAIDVDIDLEPDGALEEF
jgi:hypothetical protein